MIPIRFSLVESVTAPGSITLHSTSDFETFCRDVVGTHCHLPTREGVRLLSAGLCEERAYRSNANVTAVGRFFLGDVDRCSDAEAESICTALEGLSFLIYSSHNHGRAKPQDPPGAPTNRLRFVVELDRELAPAQFPEFWRKLNARLGGLLDPQTKDVSRCYYLPSCPPGAEPLWLLTLGEPLAVGSVLAGPEPTPQASGAAAKVPPEALADLADRWIRQRKSTEIKALGYTLRKVLAGQPFATEGARDTTIFKLACLLMEEWPEADTEALAALFAPALEHMGRDFTAADVKAKLDRQAEKLRTQQKEGEQAALGLRQSLILASYGGLRQQPATEEERQSLCRLFYCTPLTLSRYFIVGKDRYSYLLRPDGSYIGPYAHEDLSIAAHRDLAVFPEVETEYETQNGIRRRKTAVQLREDYGDTLSSVVYDLTAQRTTYDWRSKIMTVASCPLVVDAIYSQEVQDWLLALGGEKAVDCAAAMLRLDRISAAVALLGEKSAGKTLFAVAAALAFGRPPASMHELSDRFNDLLIYQPIVLADETPGEAYHRRGSTFVREQLSVSSRHIEPKYKPKGVLKGAIRLVFTANNREALDTLEDLSSQDREALTERVVELDAGEEPARYLANLGDPDYINREWLKGQKAPQHFAWLAQNWEIRQPGSRFLVSGEKGNGLHLSMAAGMGLAGEVTQWLLAFLADRKRFEATRSAGIRTRGGSLLVTAEALHNHWGKYSHTRVESVNRIGRVLRSISEKHKRQLPNEKGQAVNYWVVKTEILESALERTSLPEEELMEALLEDTEDRLEWPKKETKELEARS